MNFLQYIKWYYVIIFCLICIIIFLIFTKQESGPGQVQENFAQPQKQIKDNYAAEIILYYATWCGYSKQFLPEWQKFEDYGKTKLNGLKITKIQCEDGNENLCMQKGVEGYPTIILYLKDGSEMKFDGDRTTEQLINFINKNVK